VIVSTAMALAHAQVAAAKEFPAASWHRSQAVVYRA
jgi:hypothetical protein